MHKIGDKVKVRLSDGKVKKDVIKDILPTLYTHTHTHTAAAGRPDRRD